MKNLYLIGFMGTGKSVVGKLLSVKLGIEFVDLDSYIQSKLNTTITDIFAQKGEDYFRQLEKHFLNEISQEDNQVISCGGGIVIDQKNIDFMKQRGKIICLNASIDKILERTRNNSNRPLLNVENPQARIKHLLEQRSDKYAQADLTIDTTQLTPQQVAEKIIADIS